MKTSINILAATACGVRFAAAVNGGQSPHAVFTYTSGSFLPFSGGAASDLKSASYQFTDMGAAESNIAFASDGSLIYSPAFTLNGVGYATSKDGGSTWQQVLPNGTAQPRTQPVFRKRDLDGRYFFWSSSVPGLDFSYSDDQGSTWTNLNNSHFDTMIQDWAHLVGGKPVTSKLSNGAQEILYLSAPSLISTPVPVEPLGPIEQYIMKSTDRGNTWTVTKGMPTLQPLISGGACAGLTQNLASQELIIWGDGLVRPNGTVMYGLRRCQKLSVAISDDEGDSWRLVDVPGSSLAPFVAGDITYLFDGNVLVPTPISQDTTGTVYSIWVDEKYVLKMSTSTNSAATWSSPVIIGAPGNFASNNSSPGNVMAYLPTLTHHPTQVGRAVLAYYGSSNGGATYDAYLAETTNLQSSTPTWTSIIANPPSLPMQANDDKSWDQGYGNPFGDLVEFTDVKYVPGSTNFVAAFARRMCTGHSALPGIFNASTCEAGWNYTAKAQSQWQGFVAFGNH